MTEINFLDKVITFFAKCVAKLLGKKIIERLKGVFGRRKKIAIFHKEVVEELGRYSIALVNTDAGNRDCTIYNQEVTARIDGVGDLFYEKTILLKSEKRRLHALPERDYADHWASFFKKKPVVEVIDIANNDTKHDAYIVPYKFEDKSIEYMIFFNPFLNEDKEYKIKITKEHPKCYIDLVQGKLDWLETNFQFKANLYSNTSLKMKVFVAKSIFDKFNNTFHCWVHSGSRKRLSGIKSEGQNYYVEYNLSKKNRSQEIHKIYLSHKPENEYQ